MPAQTEILSDQKMGGKKKPAHAKEMHDSKSSSYRSGNLNEDLVILLLLRNCKTWGYFLHHCQDLEPFICNGL